MQGKPVYGQLKNRTSFQGVIVEVNEKEVKVQVKRCTLAPQKIGKVYSTPKKNVQEIAHIHFDELSNDDIWRISICLGYADLAGKTRLNKTRIPYEKNPTKRNTDIFNEYVNSMRTELKKRIQSEF